jgi:hypothetical protein
MCFRLFPFILHPGSVEIEKSKTIVEASREGIGASLPQLVGKARARAGMSVQYEFFIAEGGPASVCSFIV